jgi:hypothetical protein
MRFAPASDPLRRFPPAAAHRAARPAGAPAGAGPQRCACGGSCPACLLLRQADGAAAAGAPAAAAAAADPLTEPLTDAEWRRVEMWLGYGEVGGTPLTADPAHNASVIAASIFCSRLLGSPQRELEPPLLCADRDAVRADPRVQALAGQVAARGPLVHWPAVPAQARMRYVMERLVDVYGFPPNGAAGLVGNLWAESHVIPSMVQGGTEEAPMRVAGFTGKRKRDFTAEEVMNRDRAAQQGPGSAGVGLGQWTSEERRAGLFEHAFQGRQPGSAILFDMDAEVDYLVTELQAEYAGVYHALTKAGVSLDAASDIVLARVEAPGSILQGEKPLPPTDPAAQAIYAARRANGRRALAAWLAGRIGP